VRTCGRYAATTATTTRCLVSVHASTNRAYHPVGFQGFQAARPLFTELRRGAIFSETSIQICESLCVRSGAIRLFAPHCAQWGTAHVARPHTYAVGEDQVTNAHRRNPAIKKTPRFRVKRSALGRTRTWGLLIRSQDTYVCSCLWLFKNRISKPTFRSRRLQLFTCVTVKSLSSTVASNQQPAAFRCGEGRSFRKSSE
jgi:hypothetical protein